MVDLIEEVKEDIRRERYEKIFSVYSKYLIIFTLLAVGSTALASWYKDFVISKQTDEGAVYYSTIEAVKNDETIIAATISKLDSIWQDGREGYSELSALQKAALLNKQNNIEEAIKTYDDIASKPGMDKVIKDLALLLKSYLVIENDIDDPDLDKYLESLTSSLSPWSYSARELLALNALKKGDNDSANTILNYLATDSATPVNMQERAKKLLNSMRGKPNNG